MCFEVAFKTGNRQ